MVPVADNVPVGLLVLAHAVNDTASARHKNIAISFFRKGIPPYCILFHNLFLVYAANVNGICSKCEDYVLVLLFLQKVPFK